ncbi:MAG TPA: diaminopimelate decarboxylase [Candidatus Limnocylindria bacterium]|nr:diaminopimelate decarboxylase [Candidatus Limnocylindria bacterium]
MLDGHAADAAERWGTPLYLTDLDMGAARLAAYQTAFPGALIAYALKANPDPQLLRRLVADGAGCEVVTAVELALALRAGCPGERVVMNGIGKRDEELHLALAAGAVVNAESLDELARLLVLAADHERSRVGLRLNPALDAATHSHLATGAASAKFGISIGDLPQALALMRDAGQSLACLGAHIGSGIDSLEPFAELARRLAAAGSDATAAGLAPKLIDLGGGLAGADPDALAKAVGPAVPDPARLILEPGRSLVADAGWLLTRVVRTQPRPEAGCGYLVADAGMTELIRPMLYGASHPVSLILPGAPFTPTGETHLAGPICEAGDILARDLARWLSPDELAHAGDGALLAIHQVGAYGAAMASTYNGRLRPAEAVIEGDEVRLSRRRESLDDLVARDA